MSLPPPSSPPLGAGPGGPAGWYPDPWRRARLRWWDGAAWSEHTDLDYAPPPVVAYAGPQARARVAALAAPTRTLAALLPLAAVAQSVGTALSWSNLRETFRLIRDGDTQALQDLQPTVASRVGQLLGLVGLVLLVLRMVWLYRATAAAREAGVATRRSPGLACAGWIIPILNFWWPYQGLKAVTPDDPATARTLGWWWGLYLFGAVGGVVALFVLIAAPASAGTVASVVCGAASLVSAVLEGRLLRCAHRQLATRVGLKLAPDGTTEA